jgi:hypothetical protein
MFFFCFIFQEDIKTNGLFLIQQISKKKDIRKDIVKVFVLDFIKEDREHILNRIKIVLSSIRKIVDSTVVLVGKRKRQSKWCC